MMVQMCRNSILGLAVLDTAANAGLLLSSYLKDDGSDAKRDLLDSICKAPVKARDVYTQALALIKRNLPGDSVTQLVEVNGRAIIGLGTESSLETGITLHHTYGVPFVPGSALKGLACHYCDKIWGAKERNFKKDSAYYLILFGTTEDSGHIIFNDAWLEPESLDGCLNIDVMTVHHPDYYKGKKSALPSDFDDPTPIPFVSIKGRFLVSLRCDVPGDSGKDWANLAMILLLEALENWGIGAKTNAGYGRMRKVSEDSVPQGTIANGIAHPAGGKQTGYLSSPGARPCRVPCKPGDVVDATLLEEKTKKGGWKAAYETAEQRWVGHIHNTGQVPETAKPGDRVKLIVKSINPKEVVFEWPKEH